MRNVGQAIGVAAVGAVLLFGISSTVSSAVSADPAISPEVRTAVAQRNIPLMGDAQFEQAISDIPMNEAEKAELVAINSDARVSSTVTSYIVAAVIILLGLLTTPWITIFKKEEAGAASASSPAAADGGEEEFAPAPV